jgi:hypothetical protein
MAMSPGERLRMGGPWLGDARNWLKCHTRNGERVTWGSEEALEPPLTVRQVEEIAAVAVAAEMRESDALRSQLAEARRDRDMWQELAGSIGDGWQARAVAAEAVLAAGPDKAKAAWERERKRADAAEMGLVEVRSKMEQRERERDTLRAFLDEVKPVLDEGADIVGDYAAGFTVWMEKARTLLGRWPR